MRGRTDEWSTVLRLLGTVGTIGDADGTAEGTADGTADAGNTVLVEGEPGMGKSLMLAEAATVASARGTAVAAGRADELGRLMPLGPLLSALEESPSAIAVTRSALPDGSGLLMWLAAQVRTTLERRTERGPLLVALDDLQWADPATLMALRTLPAQLAHRPLVWLLARRTIAGTGDACLFDLLQQEGAARIVLCPLDERAVAEVAADTLGASADEELTMLAAQAGGNPFLLLELLTGLREENAVRVEAGVARLTGPALPSRVHAAVRRRLDEVSARTRYLLEATAMLGRSFSPAYAAEMLGETPAALIPALEEALAAGVLVATPDELSFRHELLWRSVVETVPAPVRRALRDQVERGSPPRTTRRHHAADGATAETLVLLALLAWDEGRLSRGLDLAREAVERPGNGHHPQPLAVLATMLTDLWLLDEAEAVTASAAAQAAGHPAWAAEIPVLRARLDLASGRFGSAIEQAESGLTAAGTLSAAEGWEIPALASSALSVLGAASLRAGDLPRAIRCLESEPAPRRRGASPYARLRSELVAGQISEARDGAAGGMSSLGRVYDALPRHTGALTSEPTAAAWLVRVAMAVDDERRADAVVDAAEGIAWRNPDLPNPAVAAAHARGLRERDREALGRAVAEHTDPWAKASAAEDLGVLLSADGDCRELAVETLNSALRGYGAVEAARDAARVRSRLRLLGERRRHWVRTDHPVSGWDSLTGTERTVSDLVAQGLTNRQAAEQLFISEHTVAFHLRQVFRKLGIRSRVELARLVTERAAPGR